MATRLRTGQLVAVQFLDHVEGGGRPLEFVVYGRLARVDRQYICVDCWCYADPTKHHDRNVQRYTILRSAITKLHQLERRG